MPVFHTKTIESVLEPIAQQVSYQIKISSRLINFDIQDIKACNFARGS